MTGENPMAVVHPSQIQQRYPGRQVKSPRAGTPGRGGVRRRYPSECAAVQSEAVQAAGYVTGSIYAVAGAVPPRKRQRRRGEN